MRNPHGNHRRQLAEMFSEHPRRVAVNTNTPPEMASWLLDLFASKFLLRNGCFRTSVGLPYTTPHCLPPAPYEFLTADHILAPRPANTFCKINEKAEKTTAKKCRRPRRAARRPSLLLTTPLSLLEKSTWQPSPPTGGDVLRAPAACCCQHQRVVAAATCLSPLLTP